MVTTKREWVFLLHRLPREPSAPRIALWRAIRRLGALLLGDGLVALPASPRTIEHLEWLAASIEEQGGTASVWVAQPILGTVSQRLVDLAVAAVEDEYLAVMREIDGTDRNLPAVERRRLVRRLRRELRRIASRDYFGAPSAHVARDLVEAFSSEPAEVAS